MERDPHETPLPGDVFGMEAWAEGNRKVLAVVPEETVRYALLDDGGYLSGETHTVTWKRWADWVWGHNFICNETR